MLSSSSSNGGVAPASPAKEKAVQQRYQSRLAKFRTLLDEHNVNMDALRQLGWSGIPVEVRPMTWQLLCGYLPANKDRREATLQRKREEYRLFVTQYFSPEHRQNNAAVYHQIHIDVPRTNPAVPLFQLPKIQEIFERALYIWAIRHPASGYVQGINDLITPFFTVFLAPHVEGDVEKASIDGISNEILATVEADSFWCMSKLLDAIQDFYTFAQQGIQKNIIMLKELVGRIDGPLDAHLKEHNVEYLQFTFRWFNCLLMREMPLRSIVRIWDTYLSEGDTFSKFHLYVCGALLVKWSLKVRSLVDFQEILMWLQNMPTEKWTDEHVELLLSEAFMYKSLYGSIIERQM